MLGNDDDQLSDSRILFNASLIHTHGRLLQPTDSNMMKEPNLKRILLNKLGKIWQPI